MLDEEKNNNNIYHINEFKLKKLAEIEKKRNINVLEFYKFSEDKECEENLINFKINNIKKSVQRINKLISQIKEISDKPQK
ncbi:hypothetical protein [Fluviispira sanaruensis]|uniref:Uncharacterized protein n=1 Tax=Fluviispira sanaruensis TaxID=2493639 RepID=A0A4V0P2A0_FLUSA|nr:hypothetical protein [Fluviispira sanaruensis]BBH52497.1 hypothetical protein JCM31447_09380 [Fluviispira sanaruensis]